METSVPSYTIRVLGPDDAAILDHMAPDVFDNDVDPRWAAEFFADPRHHLAVALDGDTVVGIASASRRRSTTSIRTNRRTSS